MVVWDAVDGAGNGMGNIDTVATTFFFLFRF